MVKVLDMEFRSIKKACEYFGMDRGTVHDRTSRMGMTLEEALTTPLRGKRAVVLEGVKYENLAEACRAYEANYSTVYYRIVYENMYPEEAILLDRKRNKPITIDGVEYESLSDAYNAHDISYVTVHDRKVKGQGLVEAITNPVVRSNIKVIVED